MPMVANIVRQHVIHVSLQIMYTKSEVLYETVKLAAKYFEGGGPRNPDLALKMIHEQLTILNNTVKD